MKTTLIFVYNADSGLFNTLSDMAHKAFSPATYNCNLCALTHSTFKMHGEWKDFISSLDLSLEFLHRDELKKSYDLHDLSLPAILLKNESKLEIFLNADEINACKTMNDLKKLILNRIPNPR